jgi:hypothetical protein
MQTHPVSIGLLRGLAELERTEHPLPDGLHPNAAQFPR